MSTSVNIDVDCKQHKRIAELEANVVHLSTLCGGFESERKQLRDDIFRLETECETLKKELENSNKANDNLFAVSANNTNQQETTKTTKNKLCQTDFFPVQETIVKEIISEVKQVEQFSQTEVSYECAKNMAIVKPMTQNLPESVSESDDDEYTYRAENRANATVSASSARRSPATTSTHNEPSPSNFDVDHSSAKSDGGTASLFYINELARKEIELADYRLRVREYECSLREVQWKYNSDKYRLQSRIADLEALNNTFIGRQPKDTDRGQSSNASANHTLLTNINVAYIKNVLNKMLETKEKEKKEIMIKALITALNSMQT